MLYFYRWNQGPVVYLVSMLYLTHSGTGSIPVWSTTKVTLFLRVVFYFSKKTSHLIDLMDFKDFSDFIHTLPPTTTGYEHKNQTASASSCRRLREPLL